MMKSGEATWERRRCTALKSEWMIVPVLVGIIAGLLFVNNSITPGDLSRQIEKGLRERLGTVAEVHVKLAGPRGYRMLKGNFSRAEVQIRGFDVGPLALNSAVTPTVAVPSPGNPKTGHVREFIVDCRDFTYDGCRIEKLVLSLHNVRYDLDAAKERNQLHIFSMDPGTAEVQVPEWSLQNKMRSMLEGVTQAKLLLLPGKVLVTGQKEVLHVRLPFSVEGRLVPRKNEVHFARPWLKVGVVGLPRGFTEWLLEEINPVFTFDEKQEFPFTADIGAISIQKKTLCAEANLILRKPATLL